jgi:hypothetical protein
MKILPGFKFLQTKHCVTGSLLHLFRFHDCPVSEEMLLGLGSGVGFIYWHQKGTLPFLGGRANVGRKKKEECLEVAAAVRCGVSAQKHTSSSPTKAQTEMLRRLDQGEPLMIQVDMGLLPYFPFYGQYHFGYHVVVAAGFDSQTGEITLADRDATPYPVPLTQVTAARSSTFKPFPPQNTWMEYDFSAFHQPRQETVQAAILQCAHEMLHPPIKNLGIQGIRTAGKRISAWVDELDDEAISSACANLELYIRSDAGTGGGLFRWMYAAFLEEAADLLANKDVKNTAAEMKNAGDQWEHFADLISPIKDSHMLRKKAQELNRDLETLANSEQSVWTTLDQVCQE